MPKTKPTKDGWATAAPKLSGGDDPAPDELVEGDEWIGVVATADYIGQDVSRIELSDVSVKGGRWSGVTIERVRATDVAFTNCDLSGFVLQEDPSLRRVAFTGCRLSGAVFAGAQFHDVSFTDCAMDEVNFRMAEFERVTFDNCPLVAADFYSAKLDKVRATRCDFRGVTLSKAMLSDVDLRTSTLEDILGAEALRGATIEPAQVVSLARSLAIALELKVVDEDVS